MKNSALHCLGRISQHEHDTIGRSRVLDLMSEKIRITGAAVFRHDDIENRTCIKHRYIDYRSADRLEI